MAAMEDIPAVYTRPHDPARPLACLDETAERFERHSMPKHGSWLNMAEAELSVLARQCLEGEREIRFSPSCEWSRRHLGTTGSNSREGWAALCRIVSVPTL